MIPFPRAHLHVVAQTHAGMADKQNEDRFAVTAYRLAADNPTPALFAVIADGIGGHRAGEVAAEIAVNILILSPSAMGNNLLKRCNMRFRPPVRKLMYKDAKRNIWEWAQRARAR